MPKFEEHHYRPLPPCVEVCSGGTEGHGLFATQDIPAGSKLGITHRILFDGLESVRTPLGGFLNHSDKPNSMLIPQDNLRILWTARPIAVGEELTIYYTVGYEDILPNFGGPKFYPL
jgi:hypothetical protein